MASASSGGAGSANGAHGRLESFEDLIRRQQEGPTNGNEWNIGQDSLLDVSSAFAQSERHTRRRSSGGDTIVGPRHVEESNHLDVDGHEYDTDLESSTLTVRPNAQGQEQTPSPQQSHRKSPTASPHSEREQRESRWNGFHLWRAESYQRRVSLQQLSDERRRLQNERQQRWPQWTANAIRMKLNGFGKRFLIVDHVRHLKSITGWQIFALTIVFSGVQVSWSLQTGYATPYMLSIGMSRASTTLAWVAAPISGLVVQPVVGILSDMSHSKYKRRQYMLGSAVVLLLSTFVLAFNLPLSNALADILHAGVADWDPVRTQTRDAIQHFNAVTSFIFIDVAINGIQVAARALVFDVSHSSMHARVNAWATVMMRAGGVFGYAVGWSDLDSSFLLAWLGGDQFRKYAVVSMLAIALCTSATCICISETEEAQGDHQSQGLEDEGTSVNTGPTVTSANAPHSQTPAVPLKEHFKRAFTHIWQTFRRLPRSTRRIFLVQILANAAIFPFLVYGSEWIIEVWSSERKNNPKKHADSPYKQQDDLEQAERIGSYALLLSAIVSLFAAIILPYFVLANHVASPKKVNPRQQRPRLESDDEDDEEDEADDENGPLLPTMRRTKTKSPPWWYITMRSLWCAALVLFFVQLSVLTFFVDQSTTLTVALIASIGVPIAVFLWIPNALVMETISEAEAGTSPFEFQGDWFSPERVRERKRARQAAQQRREEDRAAQHTVIHSDMDSSASSRARVARAVQDCGPLVEGRRTPRGGERESSQSGLRSIVARGDSVLGSTSPSRMATSGGDRSKRILGRNLSGERVATGGLLAPIEDELVDESVGATILGLHNVAIVIPQIFIALLFAVLLRQNLSGGGRSKLTAAEDGQPTNGLSVVWVLRWAGLGALCAAVLTRFVPLSQTERVILGDRATLQQIAYAEMSLEASDDEAASEI